MDAETRMLINLAIGRILRLGSRPTQPGDVEDYERCRAIIMEHAPKRAPDYEVNWARDRLKGAAGD
jgi:hypothetical protein